MNYSDDFIAVRAQLDSEFHGNYEDERRSLQDSIALEVLNSSLLHAMDATTTEDSCDVNDCSHSNHITVSHLYPYASQPSSPQWLLLTAGPMGAGKTYCIKWMQEQGYITLDNPVIIDMDCLRLKLPEAEYLQVGGVYPM
jgi:hypothetical protein